jgi:hypothetical protein
MLWLFGQIWLWLLISFGLGAAVTALFLTRLNRVRTSAGSEISPVDDDTEYFETDDYDDPYYRKPEPAYPPRAPEGWSPEPDERTESGRREGMLPPAHLPPDQWGADPAPGEEPAWPKAEDSRR